MACNDQVRLSGLLVSWQTLLTLRIEQILFPSLSAYSSFHSSSHWTLLPREFVFSAAQINRPRTPKWVSHRSLPRH
jgi:hypothetical protein